MKKKRYYTTKQGSKITVLNTVVNSQKPTQSKPNLTFGARYEFGQLQQGVKGCESTRYVVCLMGATGCGKTELALRLVEEFPFEIISVDSAMIYRGMDIGTAKPDKEILKKIPHHLIDIRDPSETYSAADFRRDALILIEEIFQRKKIPLLVGGTMLYFKILQQGISKLPKANLKVREKITKAAKKNGWSALHKKLKTIDFTTANRISENDSQRIQRALELIELTGQTPTTLYEKNRMETFPHKIIPLAVMPKSREWLHQKIEKRFDEMLEKGFIEEVKTLFNRGDLHRDLPSMRAVGYRQVWDFLEGKSDGKVMPGLTQKDEMLGESGRGTGVYLNVNEDSKRAFNNADHFSRKSRMREKAIIATRQLAKRQLTWLKSWENLREISNRPEEIIAFLKTRIHI